MLTRIRNGQRAKKDSVLSPASKLRAHVLEVLQREGYIRGFTEDTTGVHPQLRIELKYFEGQPAIRHVARVSKPGRRVYSGSKELPVIRNGLGITIVSTPRGVLSDAEARAANVGVLMSRIGKKPVAIPAGVSANIADGVLTVKGPKGTLTLSLVDDITYAVNDGEISVKPANDTRRARAFWGMQRTLVSNLVTGVTEGYTKTLLITGVGYRATAQGANLKLQLGYSHDVDFPVPAGIEIKTPDNTTINITGIDKQQVGQVAAEIRRWRKPEPYKGKGIKEEEVMAKLSLFARRRRRVRTALKANSGGRPRLSVHRSGRHIYVQIIDDAQGRTLAASSTLVKGEKAIGPNVDAAAKVGKDIAEKAKAAGITAVVFDRGGFLFHGRVKALADAAREGGLEF
eukprot:gene3653-3702_t